MSKGNRQNCFRADPTIRNDTNEILGWQRLENWHKHFQSVFLLGEFLLQQKVFVMQNYFRIDIFNKNPKGFRMAMHFFIPLEIGCDGQFDTQSRPGHGLDVAQ